MSTGPSFAMSRVTTTSCSVYGEITSPAAATYRSWPIKVEESYGLHGQGGTMAGQRRIPCP